MIAYKQLLAYVYNKGVHKKDRTGTGVIGYGDLKYSIDVDYNRFPLITGKKMFFNTVITELLWYLRGDTNVKYLNDHGVHIWNAWADDQGELGPVYGKQWRDYNGEDQIRILESELKHKNKFSSFCVNAWNEGELDQMKLPPCHAYWTVFKQPGSYILNISMYQRSADMFVGVPYNIATYSLLLLILCTVHGYKPGRLYHHIGDAHIYSNHIDAVEEYLKRQLYKLPKVHIEKKDSVLYYTHDDFKLIDYQHNSFIKVPVAV